MTGFKTEPLTARNNSGHEDLPSQILASPDVALVAAGSFACIRTLYFQAKRTGKLHHFFSCCLSDREYALGRQEKRITDTIRQAAAAKGVKGVIFYASCMEVLTMWDFQGAIESIRDHLPVPVEILYRGPLAKRKREPLEELRQILQRWNLPPGSEALPPSVSSAQPPPPPDFEGILSLLQEWDCDTFLFTAGGCKKCLSCSETQFSYRNCRNSRFDDRFAATGDLSGICQILLSDFPEKRPLYLLSSAVTHTIGLDLEQLACELTQFGKQTIYLPSSGFHTASYGMKQAWLSLGRRFLSGRTKIVRGLIWILGFSRLTCPSERDTECHPVDFLDMGNPFSGTQKNLSQQIKQLERQAYTVEIWRETFLHPEEAVLPERTLVAAPEGLPLAKWMEQKFGIPFYW